ncbi:NAD(P)-dependent oxidoreductase [Candidatus Nanohalobium constans]|uniref:D-lactate dehydrogenase n=1 Tax=Candidatus Nanohalobium constans TaxID=2565781 RepID=A0A5Q0UFU0_9ARCH|nr:NAD(P)-dependent oxidoreductase [Candidatus Nanohalobium constans]QGA80414.1 D-lactate dehydrogenase [Candidatus Nanohalobium constans]
MTVEKVAWFDTENWEKEYLENKDFPFEIKFFEESLTKDTAAKTEGFDAVSVFVSSQVSSEVIEELDVDIIACRSTGFDHVDIETASEQGIKICNVPRYGANTVAEHAFGLILTLSRRIHEAISKVENGEFDHQGLKGFDLEGKTLGVVGTGSIGQKVIEMAHGFNMDVLASDPYPKEGLEEELGFMYVSMEDLIKKSDIITIHCPLTDENHHLFSEEQFKLMDETVLINTARGELVDTTALIRALENGNVSRAGLDVLEEECVIEEDIEILGDISDECDPQKIVEDHILMERDDVVVTPHNAFNSREALQRIEDKTLENIEKGRNTVN